MPRVNVVKKAVKDQGTCKCGKEIKAGDAYKWIKFRYGGRRVKCADCSFKASELTQSEFLSTMYDLNDRLEDLSGDDPSEIQSEIEDIASEFNNLADETQGKYDNMPEGLQQGDTGQLLEQRASECQDVASNLEGIDCEFDHEGAKDELREEFIMNGVHTEELTDEQKAEFRKDAEAEVADVIENKENATTVTYTEDLLKEFLERTKTEEGKQAEIEERYKELCEEYVEEGITEEEMKEKIEEALAEKIEEFCQGIIEEAQGYTYQGE